MKNRTVADSVISGTSAGTCSASSLFPRESSPIAEAIMVAIVSRAAKNTRAVRPMTRPTTSSDQITLITADADAPFSW